jgi:hypothetical protein
MKGMLRTICFAVAVCSALSCGGALAHDDQEASKGAEGPGGAKKTLSAPLPAPDSPYGAWDLVALDGMTGGNGSTQTAGHLFLELKDDGAAVALQCTRPYFDSTTSTFRCSDESAYECHYGTIVKESAGWRVDIPELRAPAKSGRGLVALGQNDQISIEYILPKYSAGHFVRVADDSPTKSCSER